MILSRVGAAAMALAVLFLAPSIARACDERVPGSCRVQHATPPSENVEVAPPSTRSSRRATRRGTRTARALPTSAGRSRIRFQQRKVTRSGSQKRRYSSRRRSIGATLAAAENGSEIVGQYSASEREPAPPLPRPVPRTPKADEASAQSVTLPLSMNPPGAAAASTLTAPLASSPGAEPHMVGSAPEAASSQAAPTPAAAAAVRQAAERAQREAEVSAATRAAAAKPEDPTDRSTLRTVFIALAGFLALATCARLVIG